ncbi:MAG: DUF1801 domain-containing protein [Gemmatimonadetes bacterium]|nr:DUF1801 domain-containing protein [Gemmatimonadota bacterium]NNF37777.1 DUF1801 domain-containing protein [Gemmatimonadota bacterium]
MVRRDATSVDGYLDALPADRRAVVERTLALVRKHIPAGFEEGINYGMIGWTVPLSRYPDTYNGQPLGIVSLAAQKRHTALYLSAPYTDPVLDGRIRKAYADAGKRLDMGKSCLRFKRYEDLETSVIAEVIAAVSPERFIELYEAGQAEAKSKRPGRR